MMTRVNNNDGFTIIEALVAMVILVIGIISLYAMHTVAIKGNSTANTLSASSNWGVDTIEQLLARNYDDLNDNDDDGCAGLNDLVNPDYGPVDHGIYTIYANFASNCTLLNVPLNPPPPQPSQRPKHIRVIVVRDIHGEKKQIVSNYIRQNNNL